ncbi:hypothetical protein NQ317_005196 [Molorchus minor]|uniref:Uncharacterized protein n=1 Tax=Molorchus minor TaxID=1323400 RepID=A0ABQ9IRQ2_9CUCU|nr:hypothetical protein NQ317_005196 [Molorchus minor]
MFFLIESYPESKTSVKPRVKPRKKLSGINSAAWKIRSRMFLLIENYPESKTREIFYQQKHE